MYKAISILRELFFPQWEQQLKQDNVIDTPNATTATVLSIPITTTPPTVHISTVAANTNTTLFQLIHATVLHQESKSVFLSSSTTVPINRTSLGPPEDMAETVASFIQTVTLLPVFPCTENYTFGCANGSFDYGNYTLNPEILGKNYWALFLLLFPVLTIFGNTLVILSVFRERSLQTATNYFIVSLACADLLVASVVMPFAVYIEVNRNHWDLGDSVCDTWIASDVIASTCSIFNLTAISIDRFIAVTQPIKYARHKNHSRVVYTILIVWIVSCCIGLPIILGLNVPVSGREERKSNLCKFYNSDFTIYSSLSSFYIPCLLMIVLYYKIFRAIRERAAKASHHKRTPLSQSSGTTKDQRNHQIPVPVPIPITQGVGGQRNKTNCSAAEAATTASSSFLVEGDEIEDIDVDSGQSGQLSTPPVTTVVVSPTEAEAKINKRSQLLEMGSCGTLDSPEMEMTPAAVKKKTRFFPVLTTSQNDPLVENGGTVLLGSGHGRKFNKQKNHRRSIKSREKILAQRERKATKTLAIVLGVFLACWVPFFTTSMVSALYNKFDVQFDDDAFMVTTWLGYGNSFMNPVIYTVFNEEFRKSFLNILQCKTKFN